MHKIIEYVIGTIWFLSLICVAGFAEGNPIASVVSLVVFIILTIVQSNMWVEDNLKID